MEPNEPVYTIHRPMQMLQQYILGAIQLGNQNTRSKYPITVLKLDVPSELVDFNRELDKSKVFLEHKTEILEELEAMLQAFYPVDFNTIKENLVFNSKSIVSKSCDAVSEKIQPPPPQPQKFASTDESNKLDVSPQVARTQNILSFLDDIPTASKENFSRSPAKTPVFEKKKISTDTSKTNESLELGQTREVEKSLTIQNPAAHPATVAMNLDRDWVLGQMKDSLGNVMENVTLVRPILNPDSRIIGAPHAGRPQFQTVRPPLTSPSSMINSNPPQLQHPQQREDDFLLRIRTCHMTSTGTPITPPYSYEPPAKRPRAVSLPNHQILTSNSLSREDGHHGDISFPRHNSMNSQTPTLPKKSPRQVTLDSLRNWRMPCDNLTKVKTGIIWSTPGPRPFPPRMNSEITSLQFHTPNVSTPRRPLGIETRSEVGFCPFKTPIPSSSAAVFAKMPLPISNTHKNLKPTVVEGRTPTTNTPLTDEKKEILTDYPICLSMKLDSSVILKKTTLQKKLVTLHEVEESQTQEESHKLKVVGRLGGTQLCVVKIGSFLGAFCPQNLLQMAPWLKDKVPEGDCVTDKENYTFTNESIEILLKEFTKLSTDDFTEDMVSRIFSLLKDFSECDEPIPKYNILK